MQSQSHPHENDVKIASDTSLVHGIVLADIPCTIAAEASQIAKSCWCIEDIHTPAIMILSFMIVGLRSQQVACYLPQAANAPPKPTQLRHAYVLID